MSRSIGCPFDIRDYSVSIKDPVNNSAVRIKGLETMSVDVDAETDDGRTNASLWSEKFVRSRGVSGSLEGRPIVDRATGAKDPGQKLMHNAAFSNQGCSNDRTLVIADAIGRAVEYDCVVTKETVKADDDGEKISWEWEGVGKPRELAYKQVDGVTIKRNGTTITSMSVRVGFMEDIYVTFSPIDASNRRYSYFLADESIAAIQMIDGEHIQIRGVSPGSTTLMIRTMNHGLTAQVSIAVTAS